MAVTTAQPLSAGTTKKNEPGLWVLGLFDGHPDRLSGSMIGSGIYIVAADSSRKTGSPEGLSAYLDFHGVAHHFGRGSPTANLPRYFRCAGASNVI